MKKSIVSAITLASVFMLSTPLFAQVGPPKTAGMPIQVIGEPYCLNPADAEVRMRARLECDIAVQDFKLAVHGVLLPYEAICHAASEKCLIKEDCSKIPGSQPYFCGAIIPPGGPALEVK